MDNTGVFERGVQYSGEYVRCGRKRGVEVLRYKHPDSSLSGIVSKLEGKLLTARYVVEADDLPGFKVHPAPHLDIAFKEEPEVKGPKLGYVERPHIDHVEVITSRIEKPDNLVVVPGRISLFMFPTPLREFIPNENDYELFMPGASGSPIIYKGYVIGIIPFTNVHLKLNYTHDLIIAALVFSGMDMKNSMQDFGLTFEKIE